MENKTINYKSPIYVQLREIIRNKIEEGEYLPGMAIPSENTLAETYGINRLTVRNAIDTLVQEGLLKRVQGKGVYVMGEKVQRDLEYLGGFTQTMREKNKTPKIKVIAKCIRKADEKFSVIFNILPDDEICYIKRVCYADDEPMSLEEIYIPHYIVPKLEGIDLSIFTIYEIYEFYGIKLKKANQTLEIVKLKQNDARMLNIDSNFPVFLFKCISYDENNRVIEFANTYTRGDICDFNVNFHK